MAPETKQKGIPLSRTFLRWLLAIVVIGFLASLAFTWIHLTALARNRASNLLRINVQDVRRDIEDASDRNLLRITRAVAAEIGGDARPDTETLGRMLEKYDVAEINIVSADGVITATTEEQFLNYDMRDGRQSAEFLGLLDGTETERVQAYLPTSFDPSLHRKYAAVALPSGGFVQVGYSGAQFRDDIRQEVVNAARNRHVGETGSVIIADEEQTVVSGRGPEGGGLAETGLRIDPAALPQREVFRAEVYGAPCSCLYLVSEGYYIISVLPEEEIILERNSSLRDMCLMEVPVFLLLFAAVYLLVRRRVVRKLEKVNRSLARITKGDLEETVDVRSNAEFAALSDDINATVGTLKQYIAAEAARIDAELAYARNIQKSALPSVFPPFPDRTEFSLFAAMEPAREVGGDFYDFYLPEENRLAFLIADVSGKGIPAAMFMMSAKRLLRDYAERGDAPREVFENANDRLCAENDTGMFLTAWMGFLETDTGLVRFVNAGHNHPVLIRDGKASFIHGKANLILAMMEEYPYREETLQLEPGDILYLYTDGVTEACRKDESRYGDDRLLEVLSAGYGTGEAACRNICAAVRKSVDDFAGGEPQFDDITQVCVYYKGRE